MVCVIGLMMVVSVWVWQGCGGGCGRGMGCGGGCGKMRVRVVTASWISNGRSIYISKMGGAH